MLCKRLIPCLDVKDARVVKGTNFANLRDAGDPVALAKFYYAEGADELVFLDISASVQRRRTMVEVARKVAKEIFIPFIIGGGIRTLQDIERLLKAGADRVAMNTAAIVNLTLIQQAAEEFGSQAIVLAIDAKQVSDRWAVYMYGAQQKTDWDAIAWAKKAEKLGAGEILLTSIDRDGTQSGFDLRLTDAVAQAVNIPVIASGGAGNPTDFLDVFQKTKASAALAASLFHYKTIRIPNLKGFLQKNGVNVRAT